MTNKDSHLVGIDAVADEIYRNLPKLDYEQMLMDILQEEINKEMILEHGEDWKEKQDKAIIEQIKQLAMEIENDRQN